MATHKVLLTRQLPDVNVKRITDAGFEVVTWDQERDLTQDELINLAKDCVGVLTMGKNKYDEAFFASCPSLKVLSTCSVGFDHIDIKAATKRNVAVGHTPDVLSKATADIAFLLMQNVARKAFFHHRRIVNNEQGFSHPLRLLGQDLEGKTLGIYGLGRIGFEMAKASARAFNMKIIYYNRSENKQVEEELGAKRVSFDELISQSDVLSVHAPLTPETKGVFNKDVFKKMKSTAIFVNTARGGLHNEEDLRECLEDGTIYGAGLDVTNPEPMVHNNPLLTMPNTCIFPHIGSATIETRLAMVELAIDNILGGLTEGKQVVRCVNPEVYQ